MDCWRNLDLGRYSLRVFALLVPESNLLFVGDNARNIHDLIELLHVNEFFSLINKDISILYLGLELLHCVEHGTIVPSLGLLQILHLIYNSLIITSKSFIGDVSGVELFDLGVIEFVPLVFGVLSVLDEGIVVTLVSSPQVDNCSL